MSGLPGTRFDNTVDATRGQPLAIRILARKDELEDALAELALHDTLERQAIETALAAVYMAMTGNLAHPSTALAFELNRWLERTKYLGIGITRRQQTARLGAMSESGDEEAA
jgi:hypothetical protein